MGAEFDELELPRNGGTIRPVPLPDDATPAQVIDAINRLAADARTHSIELEGIRLAIQEHGTRIETFCQRIERALGVSRNRSTDPAPSG